MLKLYIDTGPPAGCDDDDDDDKDENDSSKRLGHPFAGYFLPYPDTKYEGLVSTIMDDPPVLNWIYVDRETYEVKYGVRTQAQPNINGPFDCTRQDRRMILEGWEGFVAVEEKDHVWALYFDRDDDGLRGRVKPGTRVLEVELTRWEKPIRPRPTASDLVVETTSTSVIRTNSDNDSQSNHSGD